MQKQTYSAVVASFKKENMKSKPDNNFLVFSPTLGCADIHHSGVKLLSLNSHKTKEILPTDHQKMQENDAHVTGSLISTKTIVVCSGPSHVQSRSELMPDSCRVQPGTVDLKGTDAVFSPIRNEDIAYIPQQLWDFMFNMACNAVKNAPFAENEEFGY
jgi:hypothetical protein